MAPLLTGEKIHTLKETGGYVRHQLQDALGAAPTSVRGHSA